MVAYIRSAICIYCYTDLGDLQWFDQSIECRHMVNMEAFNLFSMPFNMQERRHVVKMEASICYLLAIFG